MARWFALAGDAETAAAAQAAADEVQAVAAEDSIFLRRLVAVGLDLALAQQAITDRRARVKHTRRARPAAVPKTDNS